MWHRSDFPAYDGDLHGVRGWTRLPVRQRDDGDAECLPERSYIFMITHRMQMKHIVPSLQMQTQRFEDIYHLTKMFAPTAFVTHRYGKQFNVAPQLLCVSIYSDQVHPQEAPHFSLSPERLHWVPWMIGFFFFPLHCSCISQTVLGYILPHFTPFSTKKHSSVICGKVEMYLFVSIGSRW